MNDEKVTNKTYEEYREDVKQDIYAEQGEVVMCQNSHYIAVFSCVTYIADDMFPSDLEPKDYLVTNPLICRRCGSAFIRRLQNQARYSTGFQFWMDGEWREGKYK